jgi:AraC-like DNA-binding protein
MGQRPLARLPDGRDVSFAQQFKAATGLPPYQYVIARRVERAKELLQS